jgi:hypothetical protein
LISRCIQDFHRAAWNSDLNLPRPPMRRSLREESRTILNLHPSPLHGNRQAMRLAQYRIYIPRPLGGEGGLHPASSSAGAGRVRGSETLGPSVMPSTLRPFALLLLLSQTNSILVKTPSPPALRSPLSPKGARENASLVWRRIRDEARAEPGSSCGASANSDSSAGLLHFAF